MIRAIFFDIDGTLLSHKRGDVPPDTREALCTLAARGIRVFVSTGRHIQELRALPVRDISFDGYVTLTGQICLDADKRRIYDNPICREDMALILPLFERREIPVIFAEADRLYANMHNERIVSVQRDISTDVPDVERYSGGEVYQATLFVNVDEARAIAECMPANCRATRWHRNGIDILPKSGGKAAGMRELLRHYALSETEIMAFGDGENDADMLRFASVGVAMGNADDAAKRSADYVTGDIDDGGIVQALAHYGVL